MVLQPGRPFWSAFTAFAANMVALFGVDKIAITSVWVEIENWWAATAMSLFVGLAVYGKEKIGELRKLDKEE